MSELAEALKFVEKIEDQNPGKSAYEIANMLRGYTRKSYTSRLWTAATGYEQGYITGEFLGKLNDDHLLLRGEVIDFGHFIASLADQLNRPGMHWSDLTGWSGDYSSWAGDIGSAIVVFHSQYQNNIKVKTIGEALDRFARDSDYTADIAACVVGDMINSGQIDSVSTAIAQYNSISYSDHIKTFLRQRLGGVIQGNKLANPATVEAKISRSVANLIRFSNGPELIEAVKDYLIERSQLKLDNTVQPERKELLQGSLHFLTHMVRKAGLNSLKFKPYQTPTIPWLGKLNYLVET
ncbi:MAG: hypothetical protein WA919_03425 [Coleofasciculaceae cyanobacterium]